MQLSTKIKNRSSVCVVGLIILAAIATGGSCGAAETKLTWQAEQGESLALFSGDSIVWRLNYGPDCPKPYFDPVALPGWPSLTWTAPPDHPWHLALWFSWKYINGVNYWEYDKGGKSAGLTQLADIELNPRDDGAATIVMALNYRIDETTPVVLSEKRTIVVTAPDTSGWYEFGWTSVFTAGDEDVELNRTPVPGQPGGRAWGGYAGLSIRFAKELTERQATAPVAMEDRGEMARYQEPLQAVDYSGLIEGKPMGIAIVEDPKSLRYPAPWYIIRSKVMSYINPAVIAFEPLKVKAGECFTLKYRIIVHPDRWDSERLKSEVGSE